MNLIGRQFGSLTVTRSAVRSGRSWCVCDCGSKKITLPNHRLLDGTRTHCGSRFTRCGILLDRVPMAAPGNSAINSTKEKTMNSNQGYVVAGNAVPTPREPTLNERLNRLSDRMQLQCDRIEDALARVNGTTATQNRPTADKIAQISPTLPLATVVEHLEAVQSRLTELASGIERIA